jgi:hypothetical protein
MKTTFLFLSNQIRSYTPFTDVLLKAIHWALKKTAKQNAKQSEDMNNHVNYMVSFVAVEISPTSPKADARKYGKQPVMFRSRKSQILNIKHSMTSVAGCRVNSSWSEAKSGFRQSLVPDYFREFHPSVRLRVGQTGLQALAPLVLLKQLLQEWWNCPRFT